MSMTDLIAATQAMNAQTDRMREFMDGLDAEISSRQGAYDALSANLKGIVNGQMEFTGTVDPDDPAPTNVDGGTFLTVADLVAAAPAGGYVKAYLVADKVHANAGVIYMNGRTVHLLKIGAGSNPVLRFDVVSNGAYNVLRAFNMPGYLITTDVDIALPTDKLDPALPWASDISLLTYRPGGHQMLSMFGGTVTGAGGMALMSVSGGGVASLGLYGVTLDGPIYGVAGVASGVAMIGKAHVTLLNGAGLTNGGTLGQNIIQN